MNDDKKKVITVRRTQDERPPDWAYKKSLKMHEAKAKQIDLERMSNQEQKRTFTIE